jgi:hypothetical protein
MLKFLKDLFTVHATEESAWKSCSSKLELQSKIIKPPEKLDELMEYICKRDVIQFNLEEEEKSFLIEHLLIPWEEMNFDDSFLDWSNETNHVQLNYLISALQGDEGRWVAQDAFNYLCILYPKMDTHFNEDETS